MSIYRYQPEPSIKSQLDIFEDIQNNAGLLS
jgi:hypothetical protein